MDIRRVALIYDDTSRPETTGVYCRRALGDLVAVAHFRPEALAQIPRGEFDLVLNIDDGLEYRLPEDLRPAAWWAIDTHLNFPWCLEKARDFSLVCAAQRDGAAQLAAAGIASAHWLPLACDPAVHLQHAIEKAYDVAFVGNLFPGPRTELLARLQRRFRNTFVGRAYFEEMARIYSAARLVFNRSLKDDVNMRVFEATACGSLVLTNDLARNGQAELFRDGVHLATYADAEELLDKAAYYLAHEPVRERIAVAGRAEALARHTYRHRMETLLERAAAALSSVRVPTGLGSRLDPDPPRPVAASGSGAVPHGESGPEDGYYEFDRPDLLVLIPTTARRVLDVGCGAGRLGEALKARQPAEVVGIELSTVAAGRAAGRLDRVIRGDVEQIEPGFEPARFDCVVCGDVLEHLRAPERFLERIRDWLCPGGVLIASLPNVRHHSVVTALLGGHWTYESAGLLDVTHLQFFTRRDLLALFERAGYRVTQVGVVPGPEYAQWQAQGAPGEVRVGALRIAGLAAEEAEEFFVYQYLVTAVARVRTERDESRPRDEAAPALSLVGIPAEAVSLRGDPPGEGAGQSGEPPAILATLHANREPAPAAQRAETRIGSRRTVDGGGDRSSRPRMRFTQDFRTDFDQFDFRGRPFALVRYGDGERSICRGVPVACRDGWVFDGRASRFAADLNAALTFAAPDYYIGISDGCCDREARDWFLERLRVPLAQVTFANIFVNGNYPRFRALDLTGTALVSSTGGDFTVPDDLVNGAFDLDRLVDDLLDVDCPILVAAGPASCILIHQYWTRPGPKQTIVDVGSALDEITKGRRTRGYHDPGSPTAQRICQW